MSKPDRAAAFALPPVEATPANLVKAPDADEKTRFLNVRVP